MKIASDLMELIGHTPLLELKNIMRNDSLKARVIVKIEAFNPGGSIKDRAALSMIETAEKEGLIKPGATLIEPTSGNTGIGLAWIAAVKGYRLILTMPDTMSVERRQLLQAYGAELVLTPGADGMKGSIAEAERLHASIEGSFIPSQFDTPANPRIHVLTTGQEVWEDTDGTVDCFVAGVGTGGTVSGVGEALKAHNPDVRIVAVEPSASAVISGEPAGPHKIQGIGAGFIPGNYHPEFVDEVMTVSNEEAFAACRRMAREEGLLAGISSGAALSAALRIARRPEMEGKTIVALLPDTGTRYLSMNVFD
ncbi:MAG: cysteine synthase A [Duncaniella sp.]|nr:cysteine synthase A [Duncaniella sp.]